jgi:signal transduction histidine kinase/CheY-like chemotaxis protein
MREWFTQWLTQERAAAHAADPAELEQALLRVRMAPLVFGYALVAFFWDGVLEPNELVALLFLAAHPIYGLLMRAWIAHKPGVNHFRRRVGVLVDYVTATGTIAAGGAPAEILVVFFLWIVIGNGFRFGRWYLHYAQVHAIVGFAIVIWLSPFWRAQPMMDATVFVMLLVIPMYVGVLVSRLQDARREAEAANLAKTRFLAAASHDLRQPMQALSMYASVLEGRTTDAPGQRVVGGIQLSVKTLERLFDSLLDISKIESGVVKPCVASFPLMPLIEQVVEAERPLAAQKGLALRAVRTSVWVESDPALLERMLKNLVTNAIRYTERGRIVVGCRRAGAQHLRLEVLDTGIGIAAEEHERIFDDYYQIDGRSGQGLGLGLPIVKSLGDLLGHAVQVRSAPGRGSIFSIELGLTARLAAPSVAPSVQVERASGRVVLVDDDVEIRRSMQLLLEDWGYQLICGATLADVETALAAQGLKPDALIVDYRLAGAMTGGQVIERLRASYGPELPALVITGNASVAAVREHLPGLPIAVKPVPPGRLRAFLSQALTSA